LARSAEPSASVLSALSGCNHAATKPAGQLRRVLMPYKTEWVEPEVRVEHNGIKVYCTYEDDELEQGASDYWFTTAFDCREHGNCCPGCHHLFDVRELATWRWKPLPLAGHDDPLSPNFGMVRSPEPEPEMFTTEGDNAIEEAIKAAIDSGELTVDGWVKKGREQ
jgi:hypothetical protein